MTEYFEASSSIVPPPISCSQERERLEKEEGRRERGRKGERNGGEKERREGGKDREE